jgi:hypothetical protein
LITGHRSEMKLENLHKKQFWDCCWRLETILSHKRGLLHCVIDASTYMSLCPRERRSKMSSAHTATELQKTLDVVSRNMEAGVGG